MNRRGFISSLACTVVLPRFMSMLPKHVLEIHRLVVANATPMHKIVLNPKVYDVLARYGLISKGELVLSKGGKAMVSRAADTDKLVRIMKR